MSKDIGDILSGWPYKPGEVNVRKIRGEDGLEKIQLRLDLGLLQMETTGRPDGTRPFGFESLLDYYQDKLAKHRAAADSDDAFKLDEYDCDQLRGEGIMYYHRYLACYLLGEYDSVVRDTARNLAMFDLCSKYAAEEEDQLIQEQYRPYVLMMNARAAAQLKLIENQPQQALELVKDAIEKIESIYRRFEQDEKLCTCSELMTLRSLAREIKSSIPVAPEDRLKRQLRDAIREERYEQAAQIRDQLEKLLAEQQNGNS